MNDLPAAEPVLDEDAADLLPAGEHVVRPFDPAVAPFLAEEVADGDRGQDIDAAGLFRSKGRETAFPETQDQGERQVLAGAGKSAVAPLSPSGRLFAGRQD